MKKAAFVLSFWLCVFALAAQENVSIGTGVSVLRNFSPQQGFLAVGHTVQATVHFSPKQSAYAWIEYYTEGRFRNRLPAIATSPNLQPQQLLLGVSGRLTYRHFSIGWKHYFRGSYASEKDLNVYGLAGCGFLFARMQNVYDDGVDIAQYKPVLPLGSGTVRRLSFDAGLGAERFLAGSLYLFTDLRTWLPASSTPSPYLHNQANVPLAVMVSAGVRVLLGSKL